MDINLYIKEYQKKNPREEITKKELENRYLVQMVNSRLKLQKLRVAFGNTLVNNYWARLGIFPKKIREDIESNVELGDNEKKSLIKQLEDKVIDIVLDDYEHLEKDLVNSSEQNIKKVLENRKADAKCVITGYAEWKIVQHYVNLLRAEKEVESAIKWQIEKFKIWTDYLEHIPGIGPDTAGMLVAKINIHKSRTVASLLTLCGYDTALNPETGEREGQCRKEFCMVERNIIDKNGEEATIMNLRFNPMLKKSLYLFFVSSNKLQTRLKRPDLVHNNVYIKVFNDYKNRITQRVKLEGDPMIPKREKGKIVRDKNGEIVMVPKYPKARIHNMAIRYMIKMFLKDLWVNWKLIEGLPMERRPYEEQKLGMGQHYRIMVNGYLIPATEYEEKYGKLPYMVPPGEQYMTPKN